MIRFKVDENLPAEVAAILRAAGHDALSVLDQDLRGSPDRKIAAVCRAEDRALVTLDLDFADILRFPPQKQSGLVVLRLPSTDKATVLGAIRNSRISWTRCRWTSVCGSWKKGEFGFGRRKPNPTKGSHSPRRFGLWLPWGEKGETGPSAWESEQRV